MRLLSGEALLRMPSVDVGAAREELSQSVEQRSQRLPNPLLHRSRVALAEVRLLEGKPAEAQELADAALKEIPGYPPAERLMCRALAASGSSEARSRCEPMVKAHKANAAVLLAWARILAPNDRSDAAEAVRQARKKGASVAALQEVIPLVDDHLFAELGVAKPPGSHKR
jgi:hypothetical protein